MHRRLLHHGTMESTTFIPLTLLIALSSLLFSSPSFAWTPIAYYSVAYATTFDQKTLYVQGGSSGSTGQTQFFSLDLTNSGWTTSAPPFTALSTGRELNPAPAAAAHSMAVSPSGDLLTLWVRGQGVISYNVTAADWLIMKSFPQNYNNSRFAKELLQAATDPSSGLIHLPSGDGNGTRLYVYNPFTSRGESYTMPPRSIIDGPVSGYVFQWCAIRSSMLLYGGGDMNLKSDAQPRAIDYTNPYLVEYYPQNQTWTRLTTTGPSPGAIMYHCMAAAYGGTKMVVFGGESFFFSGSRGPRGAIYILDVPSMEWTRGPDVEPIHNRSAMACTAAGDSYVAWGGTLIGSSDEEEELLCEGTIALLHEEDPGQALIYVVASVGRNSTDTLSSTVIFDIKNNAWTDTFMLNALSEKASKSNEAIIGGAIAAVVIVSIAGVLIYRSMMKMKQNDKGSADDKRSLADSEHLLVSDDNDRNPQAVTLKALRYAEGPRPPEYVAPQLGEDQFYREHNPALENNPQFVPRLQYQGLPTSDPQLIIPRDPQFRFGEPQALGYGGFSGMVVVSPQEQQLQGQLRAQALTQAQAYAQIQAQMQYGMSLRTQQQQPELLQQPQQQLLAAQQQRYWQELERLRMEYRQLERAKASASANV